MTDPGGTGDETSPPDWYAIPRDGMPPPQYGAPQYGAPPPQYGAPAPGYGPPQQYGYAPGYPPQYPYGYGTPGQIRPTGTSILLFFCTLGIYLYVYNYKVHDEMKRYSGRGIGGGIALLLTFLGQIAMPFITPAEVGNLYAQRGQKPPVNGWLGLWHLLPLIGGYIVLLVILVTVAGTNSDRGSISTTGGVTIGLGIAIYAIAVIAGGLIWFTRTNNALNEFWQSLGVVRP